MKCDLQTVHALPKNPRGVFEKEARAACKRFLEGGKPEESVSPYPNPKSTKEVYDLFIGSKLARINREK